MDITIIYIVISISGIILAGALLLAIYLIFCEYYELKTYYLKPKYASGMVNKSSGFSSATIRTGEIGGSSLANTSASGAGGRGNGST